MSRTRAYVIEVCGRSVGIVVAEPRGYRVFASDRVFKSRDRRLFTDIGQAERADRSLIGERIRK